MRLELLCHVLGLRARHLLEEDVAQVLPAIKLVHAGDVGLLLLGLNQQISVPTFSMTTGTAHACIKPTAGSPPNAALRRLRAAPAAPWLRTPHSRLTGRHRRLSAAAAASNAAAAAARLLLRKAAGDARKGARAAAIAHPGGQTAASAAAHAAAMEPAALAALPAALPAALAAAAAAEAASRGLHTGYTERAETMHERPKGGLER